MVANRFVDVKRFLTHSFLSRYIVVIVSASEEVKKIVFNIIQGCFFGKRTKIMKYELSGSSVHRVSKEICYSFFWDFVGDCILKTEIGKCVGKHIKDEALYLMIPPKKECGRFYSETIVRSVLKDISNSRFYIVNNEREGKG